MQEFWNVLSSSLWLILFFVINVAALFIIPIGLPGTFLQVLAAALLVIATGGQFMAWKWVLIFLALALIGEGIEFLSGQWGAKRFGGSNKAAWGALIGGIVGALIGVPVPVIGSVIAAFIGTFAGAILGEMHHQKSREPNLRVGMGAVIGRAIGVAAKLSIGLIILILSVAVVVL
jgi:uncharacterized protein